MSGAGQTRPPREQSGFEDTVKDFWVSRPRRPRGGRKVAGVAAAIGYRYGIDPVIVRVAFAALTLFGGSGVLLYLLGWLFFPEEDDQVSAFEGMVGQGRSSVSTGFTVLLCLLVIPAAGWAFSGGWFSGGFLGGGLLGIALYGTGLFLLHRNRGHLNRPVVQPSGYDPGFGTSPVGASAFSAGFTVSEEDSKTSATPADPAAPPAWDPLGAAPLAWDLPDPAPAPVPPPPPPAPRPKSKVGPATFGIALLVAGAGVALAVSGVPWFSPQHVVGLVLATLGTGLVVGAFAGGGRGLIGLAVPLAIVGMIMTSVPNFEFRGGVGDINATPKSAAELKPVYEHSAGDIDLDLTKLPPELPVTTRINNGAGNSTVIVPTNADVRYTCETNAGDIHCFGKESEGINTDPISGEDLGADGRGGPQINLMVHNGAGTVEVRRG